jgi:hypothetical protein
VEAGAVGRVPLVVRDGLATGDVLAGAEETTTVGGAAELNAGAVTGGITGELADADANADVVLPEPAESDPATAP